MQRRNSVQFLTTLTLVNAIMQVGTTIAAAVSGGTPPGNDSVRKCVDDLKNLMFPELAVLAEKKAVEVRQILEDEVAKGALKIRSSVRDSKQNGRIRRTRRN